MDYAEARIGGKTLRLPSLRIDGKTLIVNGGWLKMATIRSEDYEDGDVVALPPEQVLAHARQLKDLGADIFVFSQRPTDPAPRFPYYHEWDSIAAIPTSSYSHWWTSCVSTDLRCDVRKAAKRGVVVRSVPFTDEFVRGIKDVYDELPVRRGSRFTHYRKSFEEVKTANASFLEKSEFVGAFWQDELIGFLKIVYVGRLARLMQIISKESHRDKRPTNALIAKAVELCESKGCAYLTYGKYRYSQGADDLTAFKHRTGFQEILVPQYFIPLTLTGRLAMRLQLHRGVRALVPGMVLRFLKRVKRSVRKQNVRREAGLTGVPSGQERVARSGLPSR